MISVVYLNAYVLLNLGGCRVITSRKKENIAWKQVVIEIIKKKEREALNDARSSFCQLNR